MKPWRVFITPSAERIIKKLPIKVGEFVFGEFPQKVRSDPFVGESLTRPLTEFRSFHFSVDGKPYRLVYSLNQEKREIYVIYTGHRENFYERLRRYLGK